MMSDEFLSTNFERIRNALDTLAKRQHEAEARHQTETQTLRNEMQSLHSLFEQMRMVQARALQEKYRGGT